MLMRPEGEAKTVAVILVHGTWSFLIPLRRQIDLDLLSSFGEAFLLWFLVLGSLLLTMFSGLGRTVSMVLVLVILAMLASVWEKIIASLHSAAEKALKASTSFSADKIDLHIYRVKGDEASLALSIAEILNASVTGLWRVISWLRVAAPVAFVLW
jgi:hypothetical protein